MAIPNYQEFMLPTLEVIADGQVHKNSEVAQAVAKILNLTEEDMQEMLPSVINKHITTELVGQELT